jgi:hypothetical protein
MKRITTLLAGLFVLGALGVAQTASAQEPPKVDISAGYTYIYANVVVTGQGISLNGASGSVAYNYNKWVGFVFDIGTYYASNAAGTGQTLGVTTYLFGPRFSWRKNEKVTPFGQVLLGGGYAGGTLYTGGASPLGAQNSFAMTAGGGLDWKVQPSISVRLVQAEYLRTQFNNGVNFNQNNFRFTAGVVLHIGKR